MKKTENTRLSVIIPGYNTPKLWWKRCLKSVLAACGPNDEIICVDDGSSQPVSSFWSEISQGDSRARLLTLEQNSGQSEARNMALDASQGEYVTFVDSDDEISAEIYDIVFEAIIKNKADVTCFGVRVVWPDIALEKIDVLPEEYYGVLDKYKFELIMKSCLFEYPVNKVYHRNFLERNKIRFLSHVCPGEDTIFNLQCVESGGSWDMVSEVGYIYYRPEGTSLSRYVPNFQESILKKIDIWRNFDVEFRDKVSLLRNKFVFTEIEIHRQIWLNMWKRGGPDTLKGKYIFLRQHPKMSRVPLAMEFFWRLSYSSFRIHFYWTFLKKLRIRKLYPKVCSISTKKKGREL